MPIHLHCCCLTARTGRDRDNPGFGCTTGIRDWCSIGAVLVLEQLENRDREYVVVAHFQFPLESQETLIGKERRAGGGVKVISSTEG